MVVVQILEFQDLKSQVVNFEKIVFRVRVFCKQEEQFLVQVCCNVESLLEVVSNGVKMEVFSVIWNELINWIELELSNVVIDDQEDDLGGKLEGN